LSLCVGLSLRFVDLAPPSAGPSDRIRVLTPLAFESFPELGFQISGALVAILASHAPTLARLVDRLNPVARSAYDAGTARASRTIPGVAAWLAWQHADAGPDRAATRA
jgi:hypothetical protein